MGSLVHRKSEREGARERTTLGEGEERLLTKRQHSFMIRRKGGSVGGGEVYDTDPPARGGRLLGQPAASASAIPPFGSSSGGTSRGMSFPGAGQAQQPSYLSAGGGAGGGGVGVGDVDPRLRDSLKGAKKGGFKDWKRR